MTEERLRELFRRYARPLYLGNEPVLTEYKFMQVMLSARLITEDKGAIEHQQV